MWREKKGRETTKKNNEKNNNKWHVVYSKIKSANETEEEEKKAIEIATATTLWLNRKYCAVRIYSEISGNMKQEKDDKNMTERERERERGRWESSGRKVK